MDQLLFFGDEALRKLITNMDQLLEIRKGVHVQYMEEIRKDLWIEWYSSEEQEEKRQEMLLDEHQARLQQINGEFKDYYKQRNADDLQRAIMKLEEVNTNRQKTCQEEEKRRQIIEKILVDLVRRIRQKRNPSMAKKIMLKLLDHHEHLRILHQELLMRIHQKEEKQRERSRHLLQNEIMRKVQDLERRILLKIQMKKEILLKVKEIEDRKQIRTSLQNELMDYYKQRNGDALRRAIMKLEEVNTNRQKACQDEEKRRRIVENLHVDLVRRIRKRRNPTMAKKIMLMLLDHHANLSKLHQELLMRIHQKEEKRKERSRHLLQKEIMRKVQDVEKRILLKIQMKKEPVLKVKEIEGRRQIRTSIQKELMAKVRDRQIYQEMGKHGYKDLKPECGPSSVLEAENGDKATDNCPCAKKPKAKSTIKRIKRFFGLK